MPRRMLRLAILLLLAYLLQATVMPYLRISGVALDLCMVSLVCASMALGPYYGMGAALFMALLLEIAGSDLPGMTTAVCLLAGAWGAYADFRLRHMTGVPGKRPSRVLKRMLPMLCVGLPVAVKESLFVAYFYLTGVDIAFVHVWRVFLASLLATLAAIPLLPLITNFLLRRPDQTLLARRIARQRARKAPVPIETTTEDAAAPGGTEGS